MKKIFFIFAITLTFIFTGCAQKEYTQANVGDIMVNYKGTVTYVREVEISDSGAGMVVGAIVGAILGHQIGKGKGKDLATAAGAVGGALVGRELNKDIGQEVTIDLDNGQRVTTVIRVDKNNPYWLRVGDRVMVYVKGDKIVKISPIFNESIKK